MYDIGVKKFNAFCEALDVVSFPPAGLVLCLFATNLAQNVAFKTVKLYITGVKFHNIELGFKDKIPKMSQLQLTLRGIKRSIGTHGSHKQRLPITIVTLKLLRSYLARSNLNCHDKAMYWSAFTLAFFGFLRSSEYVPPSSTSFSKHHTWLYKDAKIKKRHIHLSIKASKTDPFREGVTLLIAQTSHSICPVDALKRYLSKAYHKSGPLFPFKNGTYLTRTKVTETIKRALVKHGKSPEQYSSHSFRIGAASTAAAAGISDSLIKSLGRWRSDCYHRYIRINKAKLCQVPKKLASTQSVHKIWLPFSH